MVYALKLSRIIAVISLVIALILSVTVISPYASNPAHHQGTLSTIAESKANATALSLTVTLASTAITLLPDDTGSAIADELSELSTPLLLIVCILYFEQFMLTAMESLTFTFLFPAACVLYIAYLYLNRKSLQILSVKFLIIAGLCAAVIPASAWLTQMIRDTFADSIQALQMQLDEISTTFSEMLGDGSEGDVLKFISNLAAGVGDVLEFAKDALGLLIDAVVILMITSCVIPVITMLLFLWCIKSVLAGKMENLEDTAMSVLKKIPMKKKQSSLPDNPDEDIRLPA